jgi:hypothetical protein
VGGQHAPGGDPGAAGGVGLGPVERGQPEIAVDDELAGPGQGLDGLEPGDALGFGEAGPRGRLRRGRRLGLGDGDEALPDGALGI